MRTDLFDFNLPEDLIALHPVRPRDAARLLVVQPGSPLADKSVRDLPALLAPGDALVFNDTRVMPVQLAGIRTRDVGAADVDVTLIERLDESCWQAFAKPGRRLKPGDVIRFGEEGRVCYLDVLNATVEEKFDDGRITLRFNLHSAYLDAAIAERGNMPLPPYIAAKRKAGEADRSDYQTIYSAREGAVAAPTAGLHFTQALFDDLDARGIIRHFLTLHVGAGTFLPVKAENTQDHVMHTEWGEISAQTAAALNAVRKNGGRIIAVGTTSLRLLESAADEGGIISAYSGGTDIFITPGYRFKAVDAVLTNFHLPRSTLFMLVAAFAGIDAMKAAYAHAVSARYRFYSYGDASLLFPAEAGGGGG